MTAVTRRGLLGGAAALLALPARAAEPRALKLYNTHTDERWDDVYHDGAALLPGVEESLTWFLRDHHANVAMLMDPGVYDILWQLGSRYLAAQGRTVTINIHSGFRTAETNEMLRSEGAARNSLHMAGQAVDVSVQGYGIHFLANHAMEIAAGGLGIYWRARFVHLDTGPRRNWYRRV
jgi:uncharacterized protein YcbK (DUF882 family)